MPLVVCFLIHQSIEVWEFSCSISLIFPIYIYIFFLPFCVVIYCGLSIYLMTNELEYIFICLLAIWISLLSIWQNFSLWVAFYCRLQWWFIYLDMHPLSSVPCGLPFYSVNIVFWYKEILDFLLGLVMLISCSRNLCLIWSHKDICLCFPLSSVLFSLPYWNLQST